MKFRICLLLCVFMLALCFVSYSIESNINEKSEENPGKARAESTMARTVQDELGMIKKLKTGVDVPDAALESLAKAIHFMRTQSPANFRANQANDLATYFGQNGRIGNNKGWEAVRDFWKREHDLKKEKAKDVKRLDLTFDFSMFDFTSLQNGDLHNYQVHIKGILHTIVRDENTAAISNTDHEFESRRCHDGLCPWVDCDGK